MLVLLGRCECMGWHGGEVERLQVLVASRLGRMPRWRQRSTRAHSILIWQWRTWTGHILNRSPSAQVDTSGNNNPRPWVECDSAGELRPCAKTRHSGCDQAGGLPLSPGPRCWILDISAWRIHASCTQTLISIQLGQASRQATGSGLGGTYDRVPYCRVRCQGLLLPYPFVVLLSLD